MQTSEVNKQRFLGQSIDFNYKMLISACKFTTLYLIKKYNERQFLFEDPMQRKHKVCIDKVIHCSCHQGNLGHCIHSLFVLVKICKLPEDHKFLFQSTYTEQQLKQIEEFSAKSSSSIKKKKTKKQLENSLQLERIKQELNEARQIQSKMGKLEVKQVKQSIKKSQKEWPTFEADTVCSICYDQIQNQTPIIDCTSCHNYFHTKCLKVWVTQQQKDHPVGSCPMCRSDFEPKIQQRILQMNQYYIKYHQSHGISCSNCKKDILIKLYKCLLCDQLYLCEQCYTKWQHKNHDRFICKINKKSQWDVSCRSQYNINKLNANLQYMRKCGQLSKNVSESDVKQLVGQKYNQFINQKIKKPTLLEHIMNSLLDVEKEVHKTYKKLDFGESDIVCCVCRKKKIVGMRRMHCKHFIDEKCLKFVLQNKVRQCPVDKKYILPGLNGITVNIQ